MGRGNSYIVLDSHTQIEVDIELQVSLQLDIAVHVLVCSGPVLTSYWFRWTDGSVALVGLTSS